MLKNLIGFLMIWTGIFGVYFTWSRTTLKEKLKIGKGLAVFTVITLLSAGAAVVLTAF